MVYISYSISDLLSPSGIDKILKDGNYDMKIKSNKQLVIDVTPTSTKLMSIVKSEPLFNYQQKKIILKKYKNYLIAKYRPSKESGDLKLYENMDNSIEKELKYVMFYEDKTVSFSDKPFSKNNNLKRLKFENGKKHYYKPSK